MLIYYATALQKAGGLTDAFPSALEGIETLATNSYELSNLPSGCSRIFDVTNFLPKWLTDEDLNGDTLMVKFLQYYYDWYYCSQQSGIYAQDVFDYIDPDNYDENVYLTALETYFPEITSLYVPELKNAISLIKASKTGIFQKKGTTEAVNTFFGLLSDDTIGADIRKTPFPFSLSFDIDCSIYLSRALNPAEDNILKELYNKYFLPYGLEVRFIIQQGSQQFQSSQDEQTAMASYNSGTDGVTLSAYEAVKIGNYIVYNMGDTASLDYNTGCSSASPPPRGITANTADMPTYTHPNWYLGISGATAFGDINISEFLFLPYENNPNTGITSC